MIRSRIDPDVVSHRLLNLLWLPGRQDKETDREKAFAVQTKGSL
jgi:hypothetical protein